MISARELRDAYPRRPGGRDLRRPRTPRPVWAAQRRPLVYDGVCIGCGEPVVLHRDPETNGTISCEDLAIMLAVAGRRRITEVAS